MQPLYADRILVLGDSWAKPIVKPLRQVFDDYGHDNIVVDENQRWPKANELSKPSGLSWITEWLEEKPDAIIVHLSIGGNDWMADWQPGWVGSNMELGRFTEIITDVGTIIDHISSIRPDLKILWSSYDYFRPFVNSTPTQMNSAQQRINNMALQLAASKPELTFLDLNGTLQLAFGFDGIAYTEFDPSYPIPKGDPALPDHTLPSPFPIFLDRTHLKKEGYKAVARKQYDLFYKDALSEPPFQVTAGLNDAWYNPVTNGQGFLITVFPEIKQMFLAWFTFDTERPPEEVTAMLGEPGHRWLTAQGPYEGNTANLTIFVTEGGVFDAADPPAQNDGIGDGTMTIEFADCTEGLVTYEMTSPSVSGEIPIQRITNDNVVLCETLANQ
jgi:hypothetical protein